MRRLRRFLCKHGFHAWELYIRWSAFHTVKRCRHCGEIKDYYDA